MHFSIADLRRWGELLDYIQYINTTKCYFIDCIIHEDNKVEFIILPNECRHLKFQPRLVGKYQFGNDTLSKMILDIRYKIDTFAEILSQLQH